MVASALIQQIEDLLHEVEEIRGLRFTDPPAVIILSDGDFDSALDAELDVEIDSKRLVGDATVFRMLGMLDEPIDLAEAVRNVFRGRYVAFYDADGFQIVVRGVAAELTPLDRVAIFHELMRALLDQHFDTADKLTSLGQAGRTDAVVSFRALAEGDATYFQFLYLLTLNSVERTAIAEDIDTAESQSDADAPLWLIADLAFPYESGLDFVEQLVSRGGIAALDRAYLNPPVSTEQVLHPERYLIGEIVKSIPEIDVSVNGYQIDRTGSFGEWGLRLLFAETLTPGTLAQVVDGWGADAFVVLRSSMDVAFVYTYVADSQEDAIEVAVALIEHARTSMGAGEGIGAHGGMLFNEDGPWVFVDRVGNGLVFIAASDPGTGNLLRSQVVVP